MSDKDIHQATYSGGCHCGAIAFTFHSSKPLAPRACSCTFCRKHNARSVSDPEGKSVIRIDAEDKPLPYRFGARTADFLICPHCGVYVAAVAEIEGDQYAVLNLNAFEDPRPDIESIPMCYDGESPSDRAARRRRVWTPVELQTGRR